MERVTVSNGHCGNKQTKSTLPTILLFSPLPNNRCETRRLFKKNASKLGLRPNVMKTQIMKSNCNNKTSITIRDNI